MTNMNKREYSALMSAVNEIMEGRTVNIYENSSFGAEVITFGVNWSACGTRKDVSNRNKNLQKVLTYYQNMVIL